MRPIFIIDPNDGECEIYCAPIDSERMIALYREAMTTAREYNKVPHGDLSFFEWLVERNEINSSI